MSSAYKDRVLQQRVITGMENTKQTLNFCLMRKQFREALQDISKKLSAAALAF
jgi:hypothetical protein